MPSAMAEYRDNAYYVYGIPKGTFASVVLPNCGSHDKLCG